MVLTLCLAGAVGAGVAVIRRSLPAGARRHLHAILARVGADPPPTDVHVPPDADDPKWIAARRAEQASVDPSLASPHDFRFTDRLASSGIAFQHATSTDVGRDYTANHYDH